jgi:uncharacterized delta-60 repeat protein
MLPSERKMHANPSGILAALVTMVLVVGTGPARAATVISETTWGGSAAEVTAGVAVAPDGGTYLAGFTTSFDPFGQEQVFVIKFAVDGSLSWQRTWEGPDQFGNDRATDVAVAPDGSVYVTGSTLGVRGDVLLLKFSAEGSLLWQRRWDGGGTERGEGVAVGSDGSVYVTGSTNSFGGEHLLVLRFGPDGTLEWQRIWGPAGGEDIAVGPDGNLYAAGLGPRAGAPSGADLVLLKLDPTGILVWQKTYSAAEIVDARGGLTVAPDGSVYVAGAVQEVTQKVVLDALLVKFTPDGNVAWDRAWGGRSGDVGRGVTVLPDGTVMLAGDTNSFGVGSDDAFILRASAGGRGLDANTWGGVEIDHADDVGLAAGGTIVLGATTGNPPPYTFQRASSRLSRLRGTVASPAIPLLDAAGTVADPGGTVATPAGSTTFAGSFDSALVRIAP